MRKFETIIVGMIIFIIGLSIGGFIEERCSEYQEIICPICECKCEKCPECPLPELAKECEQCPKTYEQELANCIIMRDNYADLYGKFQQLDTIMSYTKGGWKFKKTKDENRYVCLDYAKNFEEKWNEMGYDGKLIIGSTPTTRAKENKGHAWYAIYINAITGEFVKTEDDWKEELDFYDKINVY